MKTTVIPAQITTVEDRIAGNLNLTQMILLIIPIIWVLVVYALLFPAMKITFYKVPLILLITLISLILAIRIKGKVILQWLILLLRYNVRPRYYVFNKNDAYLRDIDLPVFKTVKKKEFAKSTAKQEKAAKVNPALNDLIRFEDFISNPKYGLSIKLNKKGALNVAFEQNK